MTDSVKAKLWIVVFVILIAAPVIILFLEPAAPERELWRELSVALGFSGLALLGVQFIPTARLPFLATLFPMDTLYLFHHRVSVAGFFLVLAHPLILFLGNPFTLGLLNIFEAPWQARAGVLGILLFLLIIATSVWRIDFRIPYEYWRAVHHIISLAAAGFGLYHMFLVNHHMAGGLQRSYWIVMAILWAGTAVYIRLGKPVQQLQRPYRVKEIREKRDQSWTLVLEPDGHSGIRFNAGQFAWLTARRSPFSFREHPFSFASSAEVTDRVEFTIKELGDFTATIKEFQPGEIVYLDGPYGNFDLEHHDAPGYVLMAGGIGSVPILSILRTMSDRNDRRPVCFFYANPDWESVTYLDNLNDLKTRINLDLIHILENPPEGWEGESGFIRAEILDRHLPENRNELQYFVCGPIPMINAVEKAIAELNIPKQNLHTERYEMA
jgi:predicted ferric reductase